MSTLKSRILSLHNKPIQSPAEPSAPFEPDGSTLGPDENTPEQVEQSPSRAAENATNADSDATNADSDAPSTDENRPELALARTEGGKFAKGSSGNPMGRPKGFSTKEFKEKIRDDLELSRERLVNIVRFGADKDAIKAAELMWNYALGKPMQSVELSGPDGGPMQTESKAAVVTVTKPDPEHMLKVARMLQQIGAAPTLPNAAELLESTPTLGSTSRVLVEGETQNGEGVSPAVPPGSEET